MGFSFSAQDMTKLSCSAAASFVDSTKGFSPNGPEPMSQAALFIGDSLRNAGKALDHLAWSCKSYVLPTHLWSYWSVVRQQTREAETAGSKFAWFDFTDVDIDNVCGRYLFALVRDFEALNFQICYRQNYRFLATMPHRRFKSFLLRRPFRISKSLDDLPEGSVAIEITDRRQLRENPNRRQIRVRYEEAWPKTANEVPMSFFVHPAIYDQSVSMPAPDCSAPRPWRIFFSGRTANRKYGMDLMPRKFGKMSRRQIIHAIESVLPSERVQHVQSESELHSVCGGESRFVWSNTKHPIVPRENWLEVLNRADFFLAAPGMEMPLCHNLVECLSRGAVPILEHPEYLDPPLQHNVNCLVFHRADELAKIFEQAFAMPPEQISHLRHGAYSYYQNHLAPGQFAKRLLGLPYPRVNLLLNAYRTKRT
jgi:hypothetical protein